MISDNSLFFSLFSSSNFFCNLSFCIWACTVLYFSLSMAAFKMRNPIYSNSPFLYLTSRGQADLQQWLFRGVLESTVAFCRDHARWHMNKKVSHYCQGCVRELVGNSGWHWCFFKKCNYIQSRGCPHQILSMHGSRKPYVSNAFCVRCLRKKSNFVLCGRVLLSGTEACRILP